MDKDRLKSIADNYSQIHANETDVFTDAPDICEAFIAGAHWLGKQVIAKLQFASDMNSSIVNREPKNGVALTLMQFSEAQIQQVLGLMRVDIALYKEDILKEIGYVKPIK